MRSVLVTRPQPGAARTASRIAALGYRAIVLPLTQIVALPVATERLPARFDAVVATSANAFDTLSPELVAILNGMTIYTVGAQTAFAARERGFFSVESGPGDAAKLAEMVSSRLMAGAEILYLCGKVRLRGFEQALERAGVMVHPLETYDTKSVEHDAGELVAVLGAEQVVAVLLYSSEASRRFLELAEGEIMSNAVKKADLLCLSARVAEALKGFAPERARIAQSPTEDALLNLLAGLGRHEAGPFSA